VSAVPLALSLCLAGPALSQQPSFNCATDHGVDEVTICGNFALAQLDRQLNDLYVAARERLDAGQQSALRETQRLWLRQRAACGRDVGCITRLYQERIPRLSAIAVAPSAPATPPAAVVRPTPSPAAGPAQGPAPSGPGRDACDAFPTLC
jgi:uncharacterized protein